MKKAAVFIALIPAALAVTAAAAAPHSISYEKKSADPGTLVTISGRQFVIVRIPIRTFTGDKYAITLPAPAVDGALEGIYVFTSHGADGFVSNVTVDGYPAAVSVGDTRNYFLAPDFLGNPGEHRFTVNAQASASVSILLGTTVVFLGESFDTKDPISGGPDETDLNTGTAVNVTSFAEWWKYTDPVTQVNALNYWIDYIRIYKY